MGRCVCVLMFGVGIVVVVVVVGVVVCVSFVWLFFGTVGGVVRVGFVVGVVCV